MYYQNDYITKNIKTQQIEEYRRQAEQDRLIARLDAQRPNRLLQLARGTAHVIGHLLVATAHAIRGLLVATDRQLDRVEAPKAQIRIRRWS